MSDEFKMNVGDVAGSSKVITNSEERAKYEILKI